MEKRIIDYIMEIKSQCRFEEEIGGECELTSREVTCLSVIAPGERLTAGDLAARMSLSPSRASRVITSVREKGLLLEGFDPRDRRAVSISLTPAGVVVAGKIESKKNECETRLLANFNREQTSVVRRGLNTLSAALRGGVNEPAGRS
jgi:DNA-binding MarR family transcriptional regulator